MSYGRVRRQLLKAGMICFERVFHGTPALAAEPTQIMVSAYLIRSSLFVSGVRVSRIPETQAILQAIQLYFPIIGMCERNDQNARTKFNELLAVCSVNKLPG
jgi:hypothetical protein